MKFITSLRSRCGLLNFPGEPLDAAIVILLLRGRPACAADELDRL